MTADRNRVAAIVTAAVADSARRAGLGDVPITEQTDILGSGLIDSLGLVDLLMLVEEELGGELALDRLDFESLDDLGGLIDQLHALGAPLTPGRIDDEAVPA